MFKKILLATDGSRLCNESMKAAIALAGQCGSRLVGLSVVARLRAMSVTEANCGVDPQQPGQAGRDRALASVRLISELARQQGVPCTVQVAEGGQPYEEIMRVAEREQCDAIFMAAPARSALQRVLLGSQTQKVLAQSRVPVLVLR
ncbi:universal stress protein [Herbaspirillum sp. YR522]|uniref:universal stress protein n=1 Tax=Herbaspirillum sp. YR522 TaxID=1144342 RepID=UPI00026F99E0|nr:universal stress protein [Herbaspirillum sp. YR522]EJN06642.1 universal stress protein UspA-like protein [Herbaspirillum sp. YR522]